MRHLSDEQLEKIAVVGPMLDVGMLGLPSAAGYVVGKDSGATAAAAGREHPGSRSGTDMAALALVPGSIGYQIGYRKGFEEALAAMRG